MWPSGHILLAALLQESGVPASPAPEQRRPAPAMSQSTALGTVSKYRQGRITLSREAASFPHPVAGRCFSPSAKAAGPACAAAGAPPRREPSVPPEKAPSGARPGPARIARPGSRDPDPDPDPGPAPAYGPGARPQAPVTVSGRGRLGG